jgi:multidrug efflux pump subunit AcrA (membrane-fusion protein)
VAALSTVIDGVQTHVEALADEDQRLGDALEIATAQLAAADVELSARLEAAEADIDLEALERAKADAAEARARADADLANQAKQQAADAAEASARAAADAVHNTRLASLENYMPGAVSGRATRPSLLVSKGQIIDIPVVFDNPLPDANYVPLPVLDTANVTNFTPVEYINKTKTGITARLRAEVLIAVAVTLNVTIFALKL